MPTPNTYRLSQAISLVAAQAADGTLFSARWTHATNLMLLTYASLTFVQTAAHTAALNDVRFQLFAARSFTVSDSAGAAVALDANKQKLRTSMSSSAFVAADIRQSNATAAGLTVGTRTLDPLPFAELQTQITAAVPTVPVAPFSKEFRVDTMRGDHPPAFATNEGLVLRGPTTVFGAAGTGILTLALAWNEILY